MKKQDKEYLQLIGKNIRNKREKKGMSQQELADYADLAKITIQRIELAKVPASILTLKSIATALEIDVSELVKSK